MTHFLFWSVAIGVSILSVWALTGNGSISIMEDPPLYASVIFFLLGSSLAITNGIRIIKHMF